MAYLLSACCLHAGVFSFGRTFLTSRPLIHHHLMLCCRLRVREDCILSHSLICMTRAGWSIDEHSCGHREQLSWVELMCSLRVLYFQLKRFLQVCLTPHENSATNMGRDTKSGKRKQCKDRTKEYQQRSKQRALLKRPVASPSVQSLLVAAASSAPKDDSSEGSSWAAEQEKRIIPLDFKAVIHKLGRDDAKTFLL